MAEVFTTSVVCPILIGRTQHLAVLDQLYERVSQGQCQVALLAGEAGIGKSRLFAEVKSEVARRGWETLEGQCFEADRALPYAPVRDALHTYLSVASTEAVAQVLGPHVPELVPLLPSLQALFPNVVTAPSLDPEQEKRRLFQALADCLNRLTSAHPLLLVIEDLHWCDDISLEALLYLTRRLAARPVLLLLTYRSDEVHPTLGHFLAGLDRERRTTEFTLSRLTIEEVEIMIRAIYGLPRPVRPDFLNAAYRITEGNPFFVEEALKSVVPAGELYSDDAVWDSAPLNQLRVPRSVSDAVQRRSMKLSAEARRLLVLAAVMGRRFDFAILAYITGQMETDLVACLKEIVAAQLVVETSPDQFAFRHALTRQAILAELLTRERAALHRAVADALETVYADALADHAADLAQHYFEASEWQKTFSYSQQAGDRAQALHAPRAAIEHYSRALDATRRLNLTPSPSLLRARASAYETLGDFDAARADYETLLAQAQVAGDVHTEWQALSDLGLLWASRDYRLTGDLYQQALERARQLSPTALAHSLNRVGNWRLNIEQPLAARQCHQEALGLFEELADQRGMAETLDLLGMASFLGGDLIGGTAYYERACQLLRELEHTQALASSLASLPLRGATYQTQTMVTAASLLHAADEGWQALDLARSLGWRAGEAYALVMLGFCLGPRGDYTRALDVLRQAVAIAEDIEHRQWLAAAECALGALFHDLLAPVEAQAGLERALALARAIGSQHWVRCATGYLALSYTQAGQVAEAEALLTATLTPDTPAQTLGQRLVWTAHAELALARGAPDEALSTLDRLNAAATNLEAQSVGAIPRLALLHGQALAALRRWREAETTLLAAQQVAQDQAARALLWRIQVALGQVYTRTARRADARRLYTDARYLITHLAHQTPDGATRDNFLEHALASLPAPRSPTSDQAAKAAFAGLTARERAIAALISEGQTNRQIADTLVLSTRTVEGHVTHILTKLGFTTRAQIAAWAVTHGLSDPT